MNDLVSICIPAYNQVVFLKKTLDSLCAQTYKRFEVIISDDSTNETVEDLVKTYIPQLKIIYNHNAVPLGSPANWNKTLEFTTGKWIKFMHHDDWFSSADSLQQFMNAVSDGKADFIFCQSQILNVSNNSISYNSPDSLFLKKLKEDPRVLFNNNRIGSPTAVMYRSNSERFDERLKYLVDIDFYMRLLKKSGTFRFIENPLITNTSNHKGQVTAASLNKETQVGEYCYLYNKVYNGKIPGKENSRLFMYLFRLYRIKSLTEIEQFLGEKPKPTWYFKLLLMLS